MVCIFYLWFQKIFERAKGVNVVGMKEVYSGEWFNILEYKPTIISPFYFNMEPMNIGKRVRFVIDWFFDIKYIIFRLKILRGNKKVLLHTVL